MKNDTLKPDWDDIKTIIEKCYSAASNAEIADVGKGIVRAGGVLDTVRWSIFQILLTRLVPTYTSNFAETVMRGDVQTTMKQTEQREPWQRNDDEQQD